MRILPPSRPQWPRERVMAILARHQVAVPALVGVRGYYLDTMGQPGQNDRRLYDDAIFLVVREGSIVDASGMRAFNANTDPSAFKAGIATLLPGVHYYRRGQHGISRGRPYPALRPATTGERLPVRRDGQANVSYGIAINIHRGGTGTTSSEGCQTIPPSQWTEFITSVYAAMDEEHVQVIPYVLVELTPEDNQ